MSHRELPISLLHLLLSKQKLWNQYVQKKNTRDMDMKW